MLPPNLNTPREVKQHYDKVYSDLIASGQYVPFLYPWATIGFGVILLYLLIDHRRSPALQSIRFPLYGFLCAFSAWCIATNRARSPAASYGVGLLSAWGTLWVGAIMFFNDCQVDFRRTERAHRSAVEKVSSRKDAASNGSGKSDLAHRSQAADGIAILGPSSRKGSYFWQSYPSEPSIERLDWVVDVFSNFRGIGWNFQTYGLPPPPVEVQKDLGIKPNELIRPQEDNIYTSKTGIQRFTTRQSLLRYTLLRLTLGFVALDTLKTLMHHDPWFWGYTTTPHPPPYLPSTWQTSSILIQSSRLLISLSAVSIALNQALRLGPIFFSIILGPDALGVRGEVWSNPPDFYGSFTAVLDHGLAGWWGSWWHQIFRFGFEAPSTALLRTLNIERKSETGKIIGLCTAFFLSGCLHACGSYTQLGDTRPILGPFRFFALQAVGILCQMAGARALKKVGIAQKTPRIVTRVMNFVWVHVWLYRTAPLFVEDFAQGGVWLYEPFAISPLRMLGFGAKDDNGWDLWYGLVFWRQGKHWWDTGLAF